jgi:tRNA A58 N-methylase Trm61
MNFHENSFNQLSIYFSDRITLDIPDIDWLINVFQSSIRGRGRVIVFNATFNNISVISWWSVLLVEETLRNGKQFLLH